MSKLNRTVTLIKGNGHPIIAVRQDRNGLCKCGSGKKQKKCCGLETKYRYSKLNADQEAEVEVEKRMKEKQDVILNRLKIEQNATV